MVLAGRPASAAQCSAAYITFFLVHRLFNEFVLFLSIVPTTTTAPVQIFILS